MIFHAHSCDGEITLHSVHLCDTTENPTFMAPEGAYSIQLRYNRKLNRKEPVLVEKTADKKKRSTYRLTTGNGIFNKRDGRILLGTYLIPGCLKWSGKAFTRIFNRIYSAIRRNEEVTVIIVDATELNL